MSLDTSDWQAFDPASTVPPDIGGGSGPAGGGAVIVLLAAPAAREGDWSARAAASLASGLAGQGRRLFLADVDLARPALHRVLGTSNDEGVSDAFVYGASIQRVARAVDEGRYFFAPAGTAVGDASSVAASGRWDPVLDGFRTARADVVLLVPSDQAGVEALLERATDVVVLAPREEAGAIAAGAADRVRAVLGPPDDVADAPAPSRGDLGDVPPLPRGEAEARERAVPAATKRGKVPAKASGESRSRTLLLLLVLLLVAVAAAWWFGVLAIPGLPSPGATSSAPLPTGTAAVAALALPSTLPVPGPAPRRSGARPLT